MRRRRKKAPFCSNPNRDCHHRMEMSTNPEGHLHYQCPNCGVFDRDRFCEKEACHHSRFLKNMFVGFYECPICKQRGRTCETLLPGGDAPMTTTQIFSIKRHIIVERCSVKACGDDTIVDDYDLGCRTCSNCGLVYSRQLVVDDVARGAQDREFEEDRERDRERTQRHIAANHDSEQYKHTQALQKRHEKIMRPKEETSLHRLRTQITETWAGTHLEMCDVVREEAARLLALYCIVTEKKVSNCAVSALHTVVHSAAIFIVCQNCHTLRTRFTPLVLVDQFMNRVTSTNSGGAVASRTVRLGMLDRAIGSMYAELGDKLPVQYHSDDGRFDVFFWTTVNYMLQDALTHESYPLDKYDWRRVLALFKSVQEQQAIPAEQRKSKTIAAVIYFQAMRDTQKQIKGAKVLMTIEFAAKIMGVSKASISTVKKIMFPSKTNNNKTAIAQGNTTATDSDAASVS
jgi:hypothetical protein